MLSVGLWIALGVAVLVGICHLAFLGEAIWVTYQMLRGRRPDIRKGAWLASASVLGDAIMDTINRQSALDDEHLMHDTNNHDEISDHHTGG